ncbi:MAG: hypothetical protein C5B51_20080 [Terriglobia bacterium]|nr:MAG: hypothetical protein C5B51_20080 [Terriglobia bacterium]
MQRRKVTGFLIVLTCWSVFALFSAVEGRIEALYAGQPEAWLPLLLSQLEWTTIWAFMTPVVFHLARRFRLDSKPYWRNALIHLFAAFVISLSTKAVWVWVQAETGKPGLLQPWRFLRNLAFMFDYSVVLYIVLLVCGYALDYYFRYQRGRISAAELQTELVRARLRWLQGRLQPHFLFNALHTVSSLVRDDAEAAERIIARISDLLRLMLRETDVQLVPLETELQHLEMYLEIERARFEERLSVRLEISDETRAALVPSLLLQPLVENAIRHGIGKHWQAGEVTVRSTREGSALRLSVIDNGSGLPADAAEPLREGVGLSSIRGRLDQLYGGLYTLTLRNLVPSGVEASISIPFETSRSQRQEVVYEAV